MFAEVRRRQTTEPLDGKIAASHVAGPSTAR
ncbi:hypothetical protein SCE1572_47735 [Sorangium cellulosum So0157-2]|uniref:Uncharacterized protein n=1 Tax=Sorangium cellulosum So0157-2 TaxID=1254432 RepID=S4YB15_SORCE|nr:hypothetical protein SCE1572_47735 [Sorangium cellulosum So0157-2]